MEAPSPGVILSYELYGGNIFSQFRMSIVFLDGWGHYFSFSFLYSCSFEVVLVKIFFQVLYLNANYSIFNMVYNRHSQRGALAPRVGQDNVLVGHA